MKSMKKILSLVIALAMVLSIAPLAMAVAGDDGMGGVEQVLLSENFETAVTYEDGATEVVLGRGNSVYNGWDVKNTSGTSYDDHSTFKILKEDENQVMATSKQSWDSNDGIVSMAKTTNTVTTDSNLYHLSFKLKRDTNNPGNLVIAFGGVQWVIRFDNGRLYAGKYGNSAGDSFYNYSANKWYDVEIFADYANKKYSYYVDGEVVVTNSSDLETTAVRSINSSINPSVPTSLSIEAIRNNLAGTAGAQVYIDDVVLTALDEKRICEIAAEKISLPSSATGNITLPTTGFGGTAISWTSDNTSLISNEGVVTRPENGDIVPVTLTATVTYGQTSVSYPYTVKVLPHTVPFYEDFEGAAVGEVAGYNNWSEGQRRGYPNGTLCWDWNIKQESANKSANIVKTVDTATVIPEGSNNNINANFVKRVFDEVSGKSASVTFKFKSDSSSNSLEFILYGNTTKYFVFRMSDRAVTDGGSHLNGGNAVQFNNNSLNVWHTARFDLDLVEGLYDLYVDGVQLANGYNYNGETKLTSLNGVGLSLVYNNWGGVGSSVDFDDIVVKTGKAEYAYSVVDFAFKGADGEASLYPEAGGSVSAVTINKYDSVENAALIAAVYDGGKLTKASAPIDITGALINAEATYPVSLPIASAATQIRVFALDKGTLVPLALDKTYEKRSPITVFIAGDSMAEDVKKDDGTLGYQREGWGMRIGEQFEGITVSNHAVGGRDTSEFISEGRLNSILAKGQRGDFVFVSFGHNDDGSNITLEDYRANLAAYSQAIKEKGMTPIFVTSISRIDKSADDSENWAAYDDDLDTYAAAMVSEAAENGDVCLDLYTAFNNALSGKTYAEAREYYVPKTVDGTHLSTEGAKLAAELIAKLLGESASTLKDLLK